MDARPKENQKQAYAQVGGSSSLWLCTVLFPAQVFLLLSSVARRQYLQQVMLNWQSCGCLLWILSQILGWSEHMPSWSHLPHSYHPGSTGERGHCCHLSLGWTFECPWQNSNRAEFKCGLDVWILPDGPGLLL